MRFCVCGKGYKGSYCHHCNRGKPQRKQTTGQRGYDYAHKAASVRYRREHPLCEACVMVGVLTAMPSESMHHIHKITEAPDQRMRRSNWLALCDAHHTELEDQPIQALKVKRWSEINYELAMMTEVPEPRSNGGSSHKGGAVL